jgi:SAM-dependent methyltransferase
VRTEADETTYNLHVVLRFELELALLEQRLEVRDLPGAWAEGMQRLLGVEVPGPLEGVLQDVHWAAGLIGYFPTYTLGNLMTAQMWRALNADVGDVEERIARGDFAAVREWLGEHVHRWGRRLEPRELLRRATGEPLRMEPFLEYLRAKLRAAGTLDVLDEQVGYYRAVAPEYADHALAVAGGEELEAAVEAFTPQGDVLELACGPGTWTPQLLRHARSLTAVDASPEMLALARERVGDDPRVRFVQADLFEWRPDRRYDVVFFGFWLSHVPSERFEAFWATVASALEPGGRVFFVDDGYRTPEELVEGERIRRRLNDGSEHQIIKVPLDPTDLERRLRALGWDIAVNSNGVFFWGQGNIRSPA